jgi:hypothetical protein
MYFFELEPSIIKSIILGVTTVNGNYCTAGIKK